MKNIQKYYDLSKEDMKNFWQVNIDSLVSVNYQKEFEYEIGENKPKFQKQLRKFLMDCGIDKDELDNHLNFWNNVKEQLDLIPLKHGGLLLSKVDFNLPVEFKELDKWAFSGSCNCSYSVGRDTAIVLDEYNASKDSKGEFKYLKLYRNSSAGNWAKVGRAYFFEDTDGNLGHAGSYWKYEGNSQNHTSYQLTTALLVMYSQGAYTWQDFGKVGGIHAANCDGFWSNMTDNCGYGQWGTIDYVLSQVKVENGVWSDYFECYVDEEYYYIDPNVIIEVSSGEGDDGVQYVYQHDEWINTETLVGVDTGVVYDYHEYNNVYITDGCDEDGNYYYYSDNLCMMVDDYGRTSDGNWSIFCDDIQDYEYIDNTFYCEECDYDYTGESAYQHKHGEENEVA